MNVKRPLKEVTHFEVVESGRYVFLLLGGALSVVWDRRLGVSVVLKQTYQVSELSLVTPRAATSWVGAVLCPGLPP